MADFNVADASVATVLPKDAPLALIKSSTPDTWFYAPRAARISRDGADRPLFVVARNRRHAPGGGGFETLGGVFAAQLELAVPIPSEDDLKAWSSFIGTVASITPSQGLSRFYFQPMQLRSGIMSIQGADQYVTDPAALQNIKVGAGPTIPLTLELNKLGADTFAAGLQSHTGPILPVTASFSFKYDTIVPECHYHIHAYSDKVYNFFSLNAKATASYWGLVDASVDYSTTREKLISSGAIEITWVSKPDGFNNDMIKKLQDSIIDNWAKNVLAKIAEHPQCDPAVAPNPSGFFGGVSVAIKDRSYVESLNLDADVNLKDIVEETFSLSFVFGYQFNLLNAADFLLDVLDDNKLPVVINLGANARVRRYSGQFGYRKADGSFVANSIADVPGSNGGTLTGQIQFATTEPEPESTEVQLTVEWIDPDWDARQEKHIIKNGDSGAAYEFDPGDNIASLMLATDLEMADSGSIAILGYHSIMPDVNGTPAKVYSGSLILACQGTAGKLHTQLIQFPYLADTQNKVMLAWDLSFSKPDGTVLTKSGSSPVTQGAMFISRSVVTHAGTDTHVIPEEHWADMTAKGLIPVLLHARNFSSWTT